jgi:hypothetical protein
LDGDGRTGVVEERPRLLRDFIVPACKHVVVELVELLPIEKESRPRPNEGEGLLRPVLCAGNELGAECQEPLDDGVTHRAESRPVWPFEEDHHRLRARRSRFDAVKLQDARLAIRK